jgi:MFS family permease
MTEAHHKVRTLWLVGALHAFTHLYQVALLPLYLPIQKSFHLSNVGGATFLVTAMMLGYFLPSYPLGMMADRFSRKKLLGFGLLINGLAFVGLSFAPNYATAVLCVVLAGVGGSFFHPTATALVARLYPVGTGRALGFIGIGASVGFFFGPLYAGWRAEMANNWRAPVLELGLLGIVASCLFAWLADDEPAQMTPKPRHAVSGHALFPTPALWAFFIAAALAFSLRDFAGSSMGSLGSLFLQHAHGFSVQATGFTLSVIFIGSAVSNPLFGHLSDRNRMRWTSLVLAVAALLVAAFPHMPKPWLAPALVAYGFFFMASYPMVEAGLMEAVPDAIRGRVFGFWITIGGLIGNLSHWLVGRWVEALGPKGDLPSGYFGLYGGISLLLLLAIAGLPCLHAIRKREHLDAASESSPREFDPAQPVAK